MVAVIPIQDLRKSIEEIFEETPPHILQRGANYFKRKAIKRQMFEIGSSSLHAKVQGQNLYDVSISFKNNKLICQCSCPAWSKYYHCKHVICTLLNLNKNFNEESSLFTDMGHLALSNQSNGNKTCTGVIDSIDLLNELGSKDYKQNWKGIGITLAKNHRGQYKFNLNISARLKELEKKYNPDIVRYEIVEKGDLKTFNKIISAIKNRRLRFSIQTEKGLLHSSFYDESKVTAKTEIDFVKDEIYVKKIACLSNGNRIDDFVILGKDYLLDFYIGRNGRIIQISDSSGWDIASRLEHSGSSYKYYGERFELDSKKSRVSDYYFNKSIVFNTDNIILKKEGKPYTPRKELVKYTVYVDKNENANEEDNNLYNLSVTISLLNQDISSKTYLQLLMDLLDSHNYPMMHYKHVRNRLLKGIYSFLQVNISKEKELKNLILKAIEGNLFSDSRLRQESKSFLGSIWKDLNSKPKKRLYIFNGELIEFDEDLKKEAHLFGLSYLIFGNKGFSSCNFNNFIPLSKEELFKNLFDLHKITSSMGFELLMDKKMIKTKKLDFSIEINNNFNIDWFEVKSEISCDGKLITDSEWGNILANLGAMEENNSYVLIDKDSIETLKVISRLLLKNRSKKKKNAKDIVQIPKLQIFDWLYLKNKGVKLKLQEADLGIINNLLNFQRLEKKKVPSNFLGTLREYQKSGYDWISFLYEHKLGACLADDMGLGKTIQAIAFLGGIKEGLIKSHYKSHIPSLLVLPPSLVFNWKNEISKFYPNLKLHEYVGTQRDDNFKNCDVVLSTYDIVRRDIEKLSKKMFNVIIFDEAQNIKNIFAGRTSAVRKLAATFKLCLTGTPLENHIGEYYSILDLAIPGLLEEYRDFMTFAKNGGLEILLTRTKPFIMRRTKDKILKELPEKVSSDIYLDLTDKQKAFYIRMVDEIKHVIETAYNDKPTAQAGIIALTAILRLRQICVSPKIIDPNYSESSPKIEYLIEKLKEVLSEGHSALVFSQFTTSLNILENELRHKKIDYLRMDGNTATKKRQELVEKFQSENKPQIFIMSLKTGGVGLNLTKASYVFHLDPWWNPAVENQATDRAHRMGQKNTVFVNRLIMKHSIEEKILQLKNQKQALYNEIMSFSSSAETSKISLSKKDFDFLLSI